jgi:hypothetical protein
MASVDFGQIPFEIICRFGELDKTEIRVLSYLYACRNTDTKQCNPGRKLISTDTGVAKSHLSTALSSLEQNGWLAEGENGHFTLFANPPKKEKVTESVTLRPTKEVTESVTIVTESVTEVTESVTLLNKDLEQRKNIEGTENKNIAAKRGALQKIRPTDFIPYRNRLFDFHKQRINAVPNESTQFKAINWLYDNNFQLGDCLTLYSYQCKQLKPQGWRDSVSWLTVQQQIGDWISQGRPKLEDKNGSNQKYQSTAEKRLNDELESERFIRDLLDKAEQESVPSEHRGAIEAHSSVS